MVPETNTIRRASDGLVAVMTGNVIYDVLVVVAGEGAVTQGRVEKALTAGLG